MQPELEQVIEDILAQDPDLAELRRTQLMIPTGGRNSRTLLSPGTTPNTCNESWLIARRRPTPSPTSDRNRTVLQDARRRRRHLDHHQHRDWRGRVRT